ncbi:hypothetical protein OQA88_8215 [Cercophora sp. LCS_1]
MRFSIFTTTATLGVALAQLPAVDVVKNVETLTAKSQALLAPAQQLSITNAPLLLIGAGPWPTVIGGFTDIIATATGAIGAMSAGPKASYGGDDATAIGNAFRVFVKAHQDLLNTLIGKAGFLTKIPFVGPPVTAVLRGIESVVDTIAYGIIGSIEGPVASIMKGDLAALDGTIAGAITSFSPTVFRMNVDNVMEFSEKMAEAMEVLQM